MNRSISSGITSSDKNCISIVQYVFVCSCVCVFYRCGLVYLCIWVLMSIYVFVLVFSMYTFLGGYENGSEVVVVLFFNSIFFSAQFILFELFFWFVYFNWTHHCKVVIIVYFLCFEFGHKEEKIEKKLILHSNCLIILEESDFWVSVNGNWILFAWKKTM